MESGEQPGAPGVGEGYAGVERPQRRAQAAPGLGKRRGPAGGGAGAEGCCACRKEAAPRSRHPHLPAHSSPAWLWAQGLVCSPSTFQQLPHSQTQLLTFLSETNARPGPRTLAPGSACLQLWVCPCLRPGTWSPRGLLHIGSRAPHHLQLFIVKVTSSILKNNHLQHLKVRLQLPICKPLISLQLKMGNKVSTHEPIVNEILLFQYMILHISFHQ